MHAHVPPAHDPKATRRAIPAHGPDRSGVRSAVQHTRDAPLCRFAAHAAEQAERGDTLVPPPSHRDSHHQSDSGSRTMLAAAPIRT